MKSSKRIRTSRSRNVKTEPLLSSLRENLERDIRFVMLVVFLAAADAFVIYLLRDRWITNVLLLLSEAYAIKTALEIFFGITIKKC